MADPLRILLVDDDEVDRLAVKRLLRQAGIAAEIDERADRGGALTAAQQNRYDCVLLDYRLPGTDGVSLLRSLRDRGVGAPVVALTGQGDEEVAVELMKAGAADYVNKNALTPERLERSLRYALAMARAEEERRLLLEREQHARREAQAANRAKDEFLATLSHELRTPLNAILGWTQLLASGQLTDAMAGRAIEIIERNTRLQVQLIDDLLDISRIITGKLRLEPRPVRVRTVVDAAVESVLPSATAKGVVLLRDSGDSDDAILCDPARMQQVISNLLSNAIKFTPDGGTVTLSERRDGAEIVLTVTDTGAGIEAEFLPHVFDRFRQQDPASTREHGGLGLGLSIVRHLVQQHGGSIEAASEGEGRGATFTVRLPLSPVAPEDTPSADSGEPEAAAGLPSLEGVHVLVVDNERDARNLVTAILERCGASVTAVESAAAALAQIREDRPDVLISDIAMPGEDGYSLIRKVRHLDRPDSPLPAAALTAYASASDRAEALLAGYQAHLRKPVEAAELTSVVASLARPAVRH
ncbi:MAG TPA: response regulator [Vicinamibacterales bacterium]|nr:response regulator [Vicinamibacterales bacterium]